MTFMSHYTHVKRVKRNGREDYKRKFLEDFKFSFISVHEGFVRLHE